MVAEQKVERAGPRAYGDALVTGFEDGCMDGSRRALLAVNHD